MRASSLKVHSTTHTQGKSMNQRQLSNGSICIERVYKPPPCKKHTSSLNQDTSRVPTKRETEIFHRIKEEPSGKWLDRLTAHGRTAIRLLAVNHTESPCTTRHKTQPNWISDTACTHHTEKKGHSARHNWISPVAYEQCTTCTSSTKTSLPQAQQQNTEVAWCVYMDAHKQTDTHTHTNMHCQLYLAGY